MLLIAIRWKHLTKKNEPVAGLINGTFRLTFLVDTGNGCIDRLNIRAERFAVRARRSVRRRREQLIIPAIPVVVIGESNR